MNNRNGVNRIPVIQSSMPSLDDFIAEIEPLWESRWLTNRGEKVRSLEIELNAYLGVVNSVLFANGHTALETILEALELTGEVITTPFTFASTTHALVRKGLVPVFADIKDSDLTLNPDCIEALITPKTTAILAVHVYGNLCDVKAIQEIADEHDLKVIYDAAHAFGVMAGGIGAASFGDASMLSFHATKVFNTVEGGAAVVRDSALVPRLQQLQNFGLTGPETVGYVGGNSKMNEFSAAMGLCNLRSVDMEIGRRAIAAERYLQRLQGISGLSFPTADSSTRQNHAYFPVRIDAVQFGSDRDRVHESLDEENIFSRKYFAPLVTDFDCYRDQFDSRLTPVAQKVSAEILVLPMYADLSVADVDRVCDVLLSVRKEP